MYIHKGITLQSKVHIVRAMVSPVVMHGCKSWIMKKAECQGVYAFELQCWRRLLSIPWTTRRSNQSILKEINPDYTLESLVMKLKFQYFGHLMWRANSLGKTLMLGDWGQEEMKATENMMIGWHHQLNGHEFEQALGDNEEQGILVYCSAWGHKESVST